MAATLSTGTVRITPWRLLLISAWNHLGQLPEPKPPGRPLSNGPRDLAPGACTLRACLFSSAAVQTAAEPPVASSTTATLYRQGHRSRPACRTGWFDPDRERHARLPRSAQTGPTTAEQSHWSSN